MDYHSNDAPKSAAKIRPYTHSVRKTGLADEAAKELLKAIRDQARKASDLKLLQLAQAYSLVVSAETTAELVDEGPD